MWLLAEDGRTMRPLLDQSQLDVAWHAGQYQALPRVYVAEQRARDRLDARRRGDGDARGAGASRRSSREGLEGFNVDDEEDWERAERLVAGGDAALPAVGRAPVCSAAREGRLPRDALLRRRLAALDLPQGDDRRRRSSAGPRSPTRTARRAGSRASSRTSRRSSSAATRGRSSAIYWDLYRATRARARAR